MKPNTVKQALKEGRVQLGTSFGMLRSPDVGRILAAAGFHWAFIDGEHGWFGFETTRDICRASYEAGLMPITRVAELHYDLVARSLDLFLRSPVHVVGEVSLLVRHNLLRQTPGQEGIEVVLAHPDAWLLGGGTDIGLWITKALQTSATIIYTGEVAALKVIDETADGLRIGAAAPLEAAFRAMNRVYPELAQVWTRFASRPIRSSGTLGGNVANGSPIGDSMPALIALGARVVLRRGEETRTIALEDLYVDYKKQSRRPGEWIEAILLPPRPSPATGEFVVAAYKNSKRNEQDISAVFAAYAITIGGGVVTSARIGYGGVAGIPKRAVATERALIDQPWNEATVRAAMQAMTHDFTPMSDMRATAAYRMQIAQNLLLRFWLEASDKRTEVRVC